jgi:hypothetical protein
VDIKVYLAEQGMTPEEIAALVGNEKAAKVMTAALEKFEEGTKLVTRSTAELEAAKAEKKEAADFWEQKVTPALAAVDTRVASANSETARYKAYLQSLKDQGYDVPDALLAAPAKADPAKADPANPEYMTREEFRKAAAGTAPDLVTLISISNEYADLYGKPYVQAEEDFAKARAAGKPFRDWARTEYKFADKRKERDQKAEQDRINALVADQLKTKEAELVAKYGSNSNVSAPLASKFDKIEKIAERKDSWKTNAGRETARKDRLSRFANVTLQ